LYQFLTDPKNFELSGRTQTDAQGEYRFENLPAGHYQLIANRIERMMGIFHYVRRFDLAQGEQKLLDLGDGLGHYALTGRLLDGAGAPLPSAVVTLQPLFQWDYSDFGAVGREEGRYQINGLRPGPYLAMVLLVDMSGGSISYSTMMENIEIQRNTERDFIFQTGHRVTATLVFPEAMPQSTRESFIMANLVALNPNPETPDSISQFGMSMIEENRLSFSGQFQGEYELALVNIIGTERITIPQRFQLNNLENDQDLGEIHVPFEGLIRFQITFDPPLDEGESIQLEAILVPQEGGEQEGIILPLQSANADQIVGPVPGGPYNVMVSASGYTCEPQISSGVTIEPGETPIVTFLLRAAGE